MRVWIYHFKAHTISNKLVSKISAQKKGKKVMTAQICVTFFWFQVQSPLKYDKQFFACTAVFSTEELHERTGHLLSIYGRDN